MGWAVGSTSIRRFMAALVMALAANLYFTPAASANPPAPRNILFLAVDDLRNWVNYTGEYSGTIHTPNIDALAAVSTRYLNAYATVPQCVGSRTSVMMGLSPATHGINFISFTLDPAYNAVYNNSALKSLPQVLSQNGYHTASTGKIFAAPLPARWDQAGPTPTPTYNPYDPGPDNTYIIPEVQPPGQAHPDQTIANWAANFIAGYNGSKPFFLGVGFNQPHFPWRVPQWAYDLYPLAGVMQPVPPPDDLADEPAIAVQSVSAVLPHGLTIDQSVRYAGKAKVYTQAYLASISHTDAMVGQVLATLAASVHAGNTDVILWSDHGFHLGEKYHWGKNTLWEESLKVPLLVSSPGNPNYPIGNVTAAVSLLDLAPTVLDLAGISPFPQFQGVPLSNAGNHGPVKAYWYAGIATIAQNRQKTFDYDINVSQGHLDQAAYNLNTDAKEHTNLWANGIPGC